MSINTNITNFNSVVQQLNDRTQVQLQQSAGRPISFYDNYRVNINNNHNNNGINGINGINGSTALNGYPSYVQPSAPIVQPEDDVDDTDDVNNDNDNTSEKNDNNKFNNINGDKNYLINKTHSRSQSVLSQQQHQQQPSLAYCLNTTVPQNLAASTIAGRHAPTRNSLRHSRMIVMNRSGKAEKYKRKGLLIQHQGLGRALVGIQTLLGSILCIVALWLLLWAPNLPRKDNSYWSALPLLVSGIIGLLLIGCCKHKTYKNVKHTCAQSSKILSVFLTLVACFACIAATVFAIIHIVTLTQMICEPEFTLNTTCVCRSASIQKNATATSLLSPSVYFHYIDLSCPEVDGILTYILIFSATANCIGIIVTLSYLYIHWKSRYLYSYSSVLTNDNSNLTCNNT